MPRPTVSQLVNYLRSNEDEIAEAFEVNVSDVQATIILLRKKAGLPQEAEWIT